jgi:hypothetical protein
MWHLIPYTHSILVSDKYSPKDECIFSPCGARPSQFEIDTSPIRFINRLFGLDLS